ncbi:imelysin family protein [Acuticoccus mangrovi]|uniref:Imelysin family protein n=1 Tax=Acuticoccus mangrovi TaxID=2796142 RepID=A0A934IDL9_9HYPH|nr:imelysin family protein [Acuticoccus mangrovi]MBJ3774603.1 imelysin family protein [Acuticoccus mangrovi]
MTLRSLSLIGAAVLASVVAGPARAEGPTGFAFRPTVEAIIRTVIVPAHEAFTAAAEMNRVALDSLCAEPAETTLETAREAFGTLVVRFSRIELYRFGPAREDNNFERLFFWPDRRSRGLRQVTEVIRTEDESATELATLKAKSVAVQGLPALEYVLFGNDAEELATGAPFRCRYGATIAAAILDVAESIEAGWRGDFAHLMETAGPENRLYRSHGEALQDILQAGAEELQLVDELKLGAVIGDAPEDAHPKRAPFWRSNLTLPSILANTEGVAAIAGEPLQALLAEEGNLAASVRFELAQVARALDPLIASGTPFETLAAEAEPHRRLTYARSPIAAANRLLATRIPGAFGFVAGFNSMDGD